MGPEVWSVGELPEVSGEFPPTTWGVLRQVAPGSAGYSEKVETLARRYWRAIRHYAARAWASGEQDADDLTQEFFIWLLQGDILQRYSVDRGSFRNYLKGLLRNFGRNYRRAERRRVDREGATFDPEVPVADEREPEAAAEREFDRAFMSEATKRALGELKARLSRGTRAVQWKVFQAYELGPADARPTYADLAARHRIPESTVRNHLHRVRYLLREEIRRELADTVATQAELEAEWNHLSTGA